VAGVPWTTPTTSAAARSRGKPGAYGLPLIPFTRANALRPLCEGPELVKGVHWGDSEPITDVYTPQFRMRVRFRPAEVDQGHGIEHKVLRDDTL
jgi:hypothetical protein